MRRFVLAAFAAVSLLTMPAGARAADGAVMQAQQVITSQIDAFLNDDEDKAYSYAAPTIKQMFPTPDVFFDMVKKGYAPVYRPGNFAFGKSEVSPDGNDIVQEVLIDGPKGDSWTAIYTLSRQPDGSWKISSVHMIKSAPPSA